MHENKLVGRTAELAILHEALKSTNAEMVAVVGRRRVGKTFLIKQAYADSIVFSMSGELGAPRTEQFNNWAFALKQCAPMHAPKKAPKTWQAAFMSLIEVLEARNDATKTVVFLDELSWLASSDAGFMRAFSFFWNYWAVNKQIVVVICGSAASWMIQNVVRNKGGLHNRITRRIFLQPFLLNETKAYLQSLGGNFTDQELIEIYMAVGGIPHYLKEFNKEQSVMQNLDRLCFASTGILRDEFQMLYRALFESAEKHISVVRTLATSNQGLPRKDIIASSPDLIENGNTTKVLEELEQSGFITSYQPFGKIKKDTLYRLTDPYSMFYLQFIEKSAHEGAGTWHFLGQTQPYKIWCGYMFETVCLMHIGSLKKALGISGVYTTTGSFYQKSTAELSGAQIDLVMDRSDRIIHLFEMKYSDAPVTLSKTQCEALSRKVQVFKAATGTKKRISVVLVTPHGYETSPACREIVEWSVGLEGLMG